MHLHMQMNLKWRRRFSLLEMTSHSHHNYCSITFFCFHVLCDDNDYFLSSSFFYCLLNETTFSFSCSHWIKLFFFRLKKASHLNSSSPLNSISRGHRAVPHSGTLLLLVGWLVDPNVFTQNKEGRWKGTLIKVKSSV